MVNCSKNIEKILTDYKEICIIRKWLHEKEYKNYKNYNKYINFISIFFTGFTATSNTVTFYLTVESKDLEIANIIYALILYIITVLNLLQHFLNFEHKGQEHYFYSLKYNTLYNNIHRMLALEKVDRQDSNYYFRWVTSEYDNLTNNMPNISNSTIKQYEKKFKTSFDDFVNLSEDPGIDSDLEMNNLSIPKTITDDNRLKYDLERYAMHCVNEIN